MKLVTTILVLITVFLLSFVSISSGYDAAATISKINKFASANALTPDQAALLRAYSIFDADKLPMHLKVDQQFGHTWYCATPEILRLTNRIDEFSPGVRSIIEGYLKAPGQNRSSDTKSGDKLATNPDGWVLPNSHKTTHFNIQWGSNTSLTQDDMEAWGVILEEIWSIEIDSWGFDPVAGTDEYYVDIYLGNSHDSGLGEEGPTITFNGAYTTLYGGQSPQPFAVFSESLFAAESYVKDVSSHEFFHTIQFTIYLDGCQGYMSGSSLWGVEGTAVWAEDEAYDEIDGYLSYLNEYAKDPHMKLNNNDELYPYSRVIWFKFMSENFDGLNTIYDLWTDGCHDTLLAATDQVFSNEGTSFIEQYPLFNIANLFMDYEEGEEYPDFKNHATISSFPTTYLSPAPTKPQLLGTNFVEVRPESLKAESTLYVDFEGVDVLFAGYSFEWSVQLLAMKDEATYDLIILDVVDGLAKTEVNSFGSTYPKLYVIVSPLALDGHSDSGAEYALSFSMEPFAQDDDDDDDDVTDDDDSTEDDDDDDDTTTDDDDNDDDDDNSGCCG